jgi:ATP-dependent DNA helicase RecQ
VEQTVDFLEGQRIPAVPYHGQMDNATRRRNQERWMNDEVRVLVGTIAFGLGINKPAVRAVIHMALPKSIEQYYQEAGRAGRDGLPADCLLLWQPKDAGLLAYFIEQLNDRAEKERAWQRYHAVRRFAEGDLCRHLQICTHFGQTPKWQRCEMCDVCGNIPEWLKVPAEETLAVKKKRLPRWDRPVGVPGPQWDADSIPAAPGGWTPIPGSEPAHQTQSSSADRDLVEFFKDWRRRTAQAAAVPAYIVMSDATLEDLCRKQPSNVRELLGVTGIGERKAELYGKEILAAFADFRNGARAAAREAAQVSPAEETLRLLHEGKSFEEIAQIRGRQLQTVVNLVADLVEKGKLDYRIEWVGAEAHRQTEEAVHRLGSQWLKPLREALPAEISYDQIRLVVAYIRRAQVLA